MGEGLYERKYLPEEREGSNYGKGVETVRLLRIGLEDPLEGA